MTEHPYELILWVNGVNWMSLSITEGEFGKAMAEFDRILNQIRTAGTRNWVEVKNNGR